MKIGRERDSQSIIIMIIILRNSNNSYMIETALSATLSIQEEFLKANKTAQSDIPDAEECRTGCLNLEDTIYAM